MDERVVKIQRELAQRDDLPLLLADVLIALALKRDDGVSPHQVTREAAEAFGFDEETWFSSIAPALRMVLAG